MDKTPEPAGRSLTPNSAPTTSDPFLKQWMNSMAAWTPGETDPPEITTAQLSKVISSLEQRQEPISRPTLEACILRITEFGRQFGIKMDDVRGMQVTYGLTLGRYPEALVRLMVERCIATWTWGNRMPFPNELGQLVAVEKDAADALLFKARVALEKIGAKAKRLEAEAAAKRASALKWWQDDFMKVERRWPTAAETRAWPGVGWRYRAGGSYDADQEMRDLMAAYRSDRNLDAAADINWTDYARWLRGRTPPKTDVETQRENARHLEDAAAINRALESLKPSHEVAELTETEPHAESR